MIDKLRLMKVNKKMENGYYDNPDNIEELREIERELISSKNNGFISKDTYRIRSIVIYKDGVKVIRDSMSTIEGFKILQPKVPRVKNKTGIKVSRKKNRKAKRLAKRKTISN